MNRYQNVLTPVDFSPISQDLARRAQELAEHYQAKLTLLHIIEDFPVGAEPFGEPGALIVPVEVQQAQFEQAHKQLQTLREQLKLADTTQLKATEGMASDAIIQYAQEHAIDLIVMGHNSHKGFLGFMMGSTAATVLKQAECDVFIIQNRPADTED